MANANTSTAIATFLFTLLVTFGIQFVRSNAEISNKYPTPLTPPGWAFSIWGLIFSSQLVMLALWTKWPESAKQGAEIKWLMAGWLSESVWQLLFALDTRISLILCAPVLIFGSYAFIKALLASNAIPDSVPKVSRILLVTSTAINAAWLTVAASLAILVALAANNQEHATLTSVSAALAVVVTVIGATLTIRESVAAYSLTLLWAFWGVHVTNGDGHLIDNLALVSSVSFAALSISVIIKNIITKQQESSAEQGAGERAALLQQ